MEPRYRLHEMFAGVCELLRRKEDVMRPKYAEEFAYQAIEIGELEIDSQGRIWRVAARRGNRWGGGTRSIPCERRRAEKETSTGYFQVRVMIDGVRSHALAHRLVWKHFNGSIPLMMTINHKNGDKQNNSPDNLELATCAEQTSHAVHVLGYHQKRNALGQFVGWTSGGETGRNARPMNPDWARSIRDQCRLSETPFFFKQMSNKQPIPDDLCVREFPKMGGER